MKIAFVYLGPIRFRGRMFKQIKTLQGAGHECLVIHGRTEEVEPDYSVYSFPVIPIRVVQEKNKLLTLATQLWFNRKAAGEILKSNADTCVCIALHSTLSGAIAKKKNPKLRYIFDSSELSLEVILPGLKRQIWARVQNYILQYADVIMHAEQHRLDYFNQTYPNQGQSFLLENLPYYRPVVPRTDRDDLRVVYLGVLTPNRHCTEMLEAFADLQDDNVHFDVVGYYGRQDYRQEVEAMMESLDSTNIRILPSVAHDKIYDVLSQYDIGLAFYQNTNLNNYYCAPNKIYDYIQLGMPVISNDYPGLRDILEKNGIGICLSEVNPKTIREAIHALLGNDLSGNITDTIRQRYSWESQALGYLKLFEA